MSDSERIETSVSSSSLLSPSIRRIVSSQSNQSVSEQPGPTPTPTNTSAVRRYQSPWQIVKSFLFRIVMIYLVTRFFRRSPTTTSPGNATVPSQSTSSNLVYTPGNLYSAGDSLVRKEWTSLLDRPVFCFSQDIYIFINEEQFYRFNERHVPVWTLNDLTYGDRTSNGIQTRFVEFPVSEVGVIRERSMSLIIDLCL